ncbi:unnamed protein product [Tuber melanosporum]|uniref:(Perigord truffle) hypothetical protein n=1 Tax=Tuber melanosporum (strain Mel28) TaxID=656061 RepID=D5GD52_TUBMM|nr:uncharacterized protein GSTUM_00000977001 [Tuber melanosporum]CAZ82445.1 unnamed protein product [Tuber melanosporum]
MSTSPYFDGSVVRYDVQRAGRTGVSSYTRERDFPRAATRYTRGISYNSRGSDYPYDHYDLTLAEQRELEEIRLRNEYSRAGAATVITTGSRGMRGGRTTYVTSGRAGMGMHPSSGYPTGIRTVSVAGSSPHIHRAVPRYTDQPVDYAYGGYPGDYDRYPVQGVRIPASSSGLVRRYPTTYENRRMIGAGCGYETGCREQVVVIPSHRALSPKRYY